MRLADNLLGKRFGKLTVVKLLSNGVALCRCDGTPLRACAGTWTGPIGSLTKGNTKSCGCGKQGARVDVRGVRFAYLEPVAPVRKTKYGMEWRCICHGKKEFGCKGEVVAVAARLIAGQIQSCGCRISEALRKDIAGVTIGRLTALRPIGVRRGGVAWEVTCDGPKEFGCKGKTVLAVGQFLSGSRRSCGCHEREKNHRAKRYTLLGKPVSIAELAKLAGVSERTMSSRLSQSKMTVEEAIAHRKGSKRTDRILTIAGVSDSICGWARKTGVKRELIRDRLNRGWSVKRAVFAEKVREARI